MKFKDIGKDDYFEIVGLEGYYRVDHNKRQSGSGQVENQMIWEEEAFEFDKEKHMKKYIKGELMSYYLLKSRWYELLDKKYFLYHKSPGGSIVRAPEGQCSKDGIQHQAAMNESAIAMEQEPLYQRMEKIRNWMDCLTESQCKVISVYVMKYQCDNLREAARETGFSIDTVNKYTKRAINRIYTRNSNIL